ncbi:MAG: hypothetical protein AUG51_10445, partial [Acidobacteria bacterium 13_1_20CM_3_53_8]
SQLGGAEKALLNALASIRAARPSWPLHLIVSDHGPLIEQAALLGVGVTVVPFPPSLAAIGDAGASGLAGKQFGLQSLLKKVFLSTPSVAAYVRRLRSVLRKLNPDLLHSNGFKMHLLAACAKPVAVPLIWHIHDYVSLRPLMARLLPVFARRCALAITNSRSVSEDLRSVCGARLKIHTVYNAIDLTAFSPEGKTLDLDSLSGLPPSHSGTVKVGLLGTLARWKGHETFLKALAALPESLPVRGYISGDAIYQTRGSQYSLNELKGIASRLGVSHRVGFTGFVDKPEAAMRSLDVIVHASTEPEPFGLVIAEAMACGRAVIVSEAGGASEIVEPGINALGHKPGSTGQLAERIMELAADKGLRERLGRAGRRTAEQRFDQRQK